METFHTQIPRELAAQYGQQAVQIIQQGAYRAPSGRLISIADLVERSVQGTVSYAADRLLPQTRVGPRQTRIEVANETTLAAVQRLRESGHYPVAPNFASATHPGGGFLSGARA